ncbi:MAG: hypothetical protein AAGN35_26105 [Bacteroidota bacterium]
MKLQTASTFILLLLFAFGCQKEIIQPEIAPAPELSTGSLEGLVRPDAPCGLGQTSDLVDIATANYGALEILNDANDIYFLAEMNHGWLIQSAQVYVGDLLNLPKDNNGGIRPEGFPYQWVNSRLASSYTYTIPKGGVAACTQVVIVIQAVQTDLWGNPINSIQLWGDGNAVLNGYAASYCQGVCGLTQATSDAAVY